MYVFALLYLQMVVVLGIFWVHVISKVNRSILSCCGSVPECIASLVYLAISNPSSCHGFWGGMESQRLENSFAWLMAFKVEDELMYRLFF